MSTKLTNVVPAHYIFLARSFVVIFGCIAVWWGIVVFPGFWGESSAERIANRIIAGEPFRVELLNQQLPIINNVERSAYCRPVDLRSAAIIQLSLVEAAASANDRENVDELLKLGNVVRRSLFCSPADPFLWLILYWIEDIKDGFRPENLNVLRMSYKLGANEGWVGIKRSHIAFAQFEKLPADLSESAISEFVGLVKSGFSQQAAEIFTGPAWRVREQLLPRLQDTDEHNRRAFADILYAKGYDIAVPGVERPVSRR